MRLPSYAVWEVVVFILNVLAFILIGLSLKPILARLSAAELASYSGVAAAVCGAVIFLWSLRSQPHLRRGPRCASPG